MSQEGASKATASDQSRSGGRGGNTPSSSSPHEKPSNNSDSGTGRGRGGRHNSGGGGRGRGGRGRRGGGRSDGRGSRGGRGRRANRDSGDPARGATPPRESDSTRQNNNPREKPPSGRGGDKPKRHDEKTETTARGNDDHGLAATATGDRNNNPTNAASRESKEPHARGGRGRSVSRGGRGRSGRGRGRGRSGRGGRGGRSGRGRSGRGRGRGRHSSRGRCDSNAESGSVHSEDQSAEDHFSDGQADDNEEGYADEEDIENHDSTEQALDATIAEAEHLSSEPDVAGAEEDQPQVDSTNEAVGQTLVVVDEVVKDSAGENGDIIRANDDKTDMLSRPGVLVLPSSSKKHAKLAILSRSNNQGGFDSDAQPEEVGARAVEEGEDAVEGVTRQKKKQTKSKKKGRKKDAPQDGQSDGKPADDPLSTTDALQALPAQEVSITASTAVKVRPQASNDQDDGSGASKTLPKEKPLKKSKLKKKKKKGLSGDAEANRRAVQLFNKHVQQSVLQNDPETMSDLLHDPRNHNFALGELVLEMVMKATVVTAMFDDALYCLRHCTLPGTLQTVQTERILSCLPQNLRNSSAYTAADMINALCIATAFDSPTSRTYFLRIVRGIALEFLEEATSARDRICSSPCERLVRGGLCVVNAHLKRGKKAADLVVDPGDQLGVFIPDTMENRGIQAGDAVSILPYAGPYPMSAESLDRNMIEATVTNTNPMVLRLVDKANSDVIAMLTEPLEGNVYRIDKLANRMGFNRQLSAAVAIASPIGDPRVRDPRRPSPKLIRAITAMDESIEKVLSNSHGGQLPKGEMTSTAALCSQAIPWNADDETEDMDQDTVRSECRLALEKYHALEGLNGSQTLAVEGATSNRLTLVQGPPGTGKTLVAIRILQHWARLVAASVEKGETPPPILATSDSNIAVDNLVEGCAAIGLRVVRLGRPEAIRPELLRYCIDRPPSSYSNEGGNNKHGGGSNSAAGHRERVKQIRVELKNAQVICCTCIGSGGDILDGMVFDRVLVDEATQATEPAVLVPLMRGCRQLVLVGDHCQLPPTVLSTIAETEGHGVPLFSRMVACGVPPFMLDTQYRMHPKVAAFPSDLFYGGLLKNGVSAPERRPLAGFPWPVEEFPVAFIPIKGVEMDDGVSKYNEDEAVAACNAVAMLMAGGQCSVSDVAVVTPYAAQAKLIRRMTRRLQENSGPPFIEVSSVDGFQGREKEAVVFSAVRSNDYGAVGFTSDWRRVNVSFTRARRALIVIGNDITLRRGDPETWGPWLAWADAHGLNMDKPGVPRGRYDAEQLRRVRGGTTAAEMLKDVLERQQAQLKSAEKQQERALKQAQGQIRATSEETAPDQPESNQALSLEEDLAQMENADGNWDDSDEDEDFDLHKSESKATIASHSSHDNDEKDSAPAADVWDL